MTEKIQITQGELVKLLAEAVTCLRLNSGESKNELQKIETVAEEKS
jgi:hypothetical protein